MIRFIFVKSLLLLLLINSSNVYSQQARLDSLAIKYSDAVELSCITNSHIPDRIRVMVVKYLCQNKLNPAEFYTTKNSLQKSKKEGYVGILKIGALRDLYNMQFTREMRFGSAGGDGDDIVVVFDNKFNTIKRLVPSE